MFSCSPKGKWLILACCLGIGCTSLPEPTPTKLEPTVPQNWSDPSASYAEVRPWLADFRDEQLQALIKEAQENSPGLQATALRIELAQSRLKALGVSNRPDFNTSVGTSVNHSYSRLTPDLGDYTQNFNLNFQISWEADLWNRLSNQERSAALSIEAQIGDQQAARLALAANVAKAWFDAIETEAQFQLLQQRKANLLDRLQVVEESFQLNLNDALDVHLARSDVASQDNRIIGLRLQRTKAIQSLEALLGRTPSGQLSLPEELPDLPAMPGTGLPSELLQRRPDLLAVERRLKAADQDAMVAYKARFPRFSLNSSVGARSEDVEKLLDLESMIWSLGVNLTQPLWNGTELEANLEQANIQTRLVALDYNRILLNALQEVEAALSAETLLAEQEAAIRRSATEARNAEDLAEEQYVSGLVSFVTVLEAQRRAFDARSALIQVRSDRLQNRIQLHLALGGDFALPAQPPASG